MKHLIKDDLIIYAKAKRLRVVQHIEICIYSVEGLLKEFDDTWELGCPIPFCANGIGCLSCGIGNGNIGGDFVSFVKVAWGVVLGWWVGVGLWVVVFGVVLGGALVPWFRSWWCGMLEGAPPPPKVGASSTLCWFFSIFYLKKKRFVRWVEPGISQILFEIILITKHYTYIFKLKTLG